jgi:hypothetical protein
LGQLGHGNCHRLLNGDPNDALALIDPGICRDCGELFLVQGLQFPGPDFGPLLLITVPARRCANDDQRQQPEEGKEKHHADPGRKHGAGLEFLSWFVVRHG